MAQKRRKRAKQWPVLVRYVVLILVLACAITGWYYWYFLPLQAQESLGQLILQNAQQRRENFYDLSLNVAKLHGGCDSLSRGVHEQLSQKKPGDIGELFKNIVNDAHSAELFLTHCAPSQPKMKPWYTKKPLRFVAAGNFDECLSLLEKINGYEFAAKIPHMSLQRKNDILMLDCTVQVYAAE